MLDKLKVLITGGHLTPGLAVIDEAILNFPDQFEFVWLGRVLTQHETGQKAGEEKAVTKRQIRFIPFDSGKTSENKISMAGKVFMAYFLAKKILKKERPDIFLSFGGYLAVPVAQAASKLKIPIITHEQTRVLGKANRLIGQSAAVIALSYKQTKIPNNLKKARVIVTGNPVRASLFVPNDEPPLWWPGQRINLPILYISGGSQGAQAINQVVAHIIPELSQKFFILHQVGPATTNHDYVAKYLQLAKERGANLNNYYVRPFIKENELRFLYPRFNLAVARSGANTVTELAAFQIPTLYIPLPTANYNEQLLNAEFYVKKGAAFLLEQSELSPDSLRQKIIQLNRYQTTLRSKLRNLDLDLTASKQLLHLLKEVGEK